MLPITPDKTATIATGDVVGASAYRQAIVSPPIRFTNLEITSFTDL